MRFPHDARPLWWGHTGPRFGWSGVIGRLSRGALATTLLGSLWLTFEVRTAEGASDMLPTRGTLVSDGTRKIAGEHGASYELPGGIRVTLTPASEAVIAAQPQMLALTGAKRTPTYSVFLKQGRVDVDIPASASGAVAVAGPADVRVICQRGSSSVSAVGRSSFVWTEKYPLLVSMKERLSKLQPGIVRRFSPNANPDDYKTGEAPRWLSGRRVWLAMPDRAKVSDFSWSPIAGAAYYRVELREAATGELVAEASSKETTLRDSLPSLEPGNYQLFVRAIDRNNMPGGLSASLPLQIVGVDVPAGAKLQADARIEMSRSQTIQLKNAGGLSVKRASDRTPRPASEPVGIANGKPTPLMIQDGDSSNACLVWLLPSQSPVVAYVGPKWVIWPHESVDLEVRWTDRSGRRLPADVEPTVMVYVGIEPIDVTWKKDDDVWRAHLGPQPGHGPWVVRLEIRDQTGALLARDFVEVEKRPRRGYLAASAGLGLSPH